MTGNILDYLGFQEKTRKEKIIHCFCYKKWFNDLNVFIEGINKIPGGKWNKCPQTTKIKRLLININDIIFLKRSIELHAASSIILDIPSS